jgi:hypothetical protein
MENKKFESKTINEIKNYMGSLGFSNEFVNHDSEQIFLTSKHPNYSSLEFVFNRASENMVNLASNWKLSKELSTIEQYEYLNKLASDVQISRLYIKKYPDGFYLGIRAYYAGQYDKKIFREILDRFVSDTNLIINNEIFRKLFTK